MSNLFVRLKQILPPAPVLVGLITEHHTEDDTSTVVLPTNEGRIEYAAGVAVGSTIRARGTTVAIGDKAFVRNGVIETRAPSEDAIEIEIGRVVPPASPLAFNGPIADQVATEGTAFSLDVSGYWSGGTGALVFSLAEGTLPAGLTLSSAGVLSGTPTTEETATGIVVRATDAAGYRADSNAFEVDVTAVAGVWVAVGGEGSVRAMSSLDGVTWVARTASSTSRAWHDVKFGNGVFVAVNSTSTQAGKVMTSPDGVTWTARSGADATADWKALAFGNGVFVAVRSTTTAGTQRIMTSPDGVTWTLQTHASVSQLASIAFGGGSFVAVAVDGGALTSVDGVTWVAQTTPTPTDLPIASWESVAYSETLGMFASAGTFWGADNLMTSPDGITWTLRTNPTPTQGWGGVCAGAGGMFIVFSSPLGGTPYTESLRSADGVTWQAGTMPAPGAGLWEDIASDGSTVIALASTGETARSADGVNWTAGTSVSGAGWLRLCWGTPA